MDRGALVGYRPWGREESDKTEQLHFHFSLSCIGEGNGNPLQCSLPGESLGRGSLVGCRLWGRTESDMTEATYQQQQQQATKHSTVHNVCICLIMERVAISLSNA